MALPCLRRASSINPEALDQREGSSAASFNKARMRSNAYRLAQQPGSYVVLKYVRKVVKRRDTQTILTAPAPANVLERSAADVSFLAAMLVDKFCWHLPLYRQHQRLLDAGITLSRSTLVYWASRTIDLLAPITDAQSAHVLASRVLAMDETSIKAGREAKGKMRTGWLWPV